MRKSTLVLLLMFVLFCFSSCGRNREKQTEQVNVNETGQKGETVMLSDRQKKILRDAGLPDEYSHLSFTQKHGIEAIEAFLTYLDSKYPNEEFEYTGYYEKGYDPEHLTAKCSIGEITAYRIYENDFPKYWDTYVAQVDIQARNANMETMLNEAFGEKSWKMFSEFSFEMMRPNADICPDITLDYYIVLRESNVNELTAPVTIIAEKLAQDVPFFMVAAHFRIVTDDSFDSLKTEYNKDLDEIAHLSCVAYPDGTSVIR